MHNRIALCAYYKYLRGENDALKNWYEALRESIPYGLKSIARN